MKTAFTAKSVFWFLALAIIAILTLFFLIRPQKSIVRTFSLSKLPQPTEGEENEDLREKFDSLRHRTAPGVDWKTIELGNMQNTATMARNKAVLNGANGSTTNATFAGGLVNGHGVSVVPIT